MTELGKARGLDLFETLTCGQCFRFAPVPEQTGRWQGAAAGRSIVVFVENGRLFAEGALTAEETAFWRRYFALDVDYAALQTRFCAGSKRLAVCVQAAPGIRVLRQPFFETLCSFIISQNNNIPRIRGIVERLCALCGEPLAGGGYAFPTPRALAACSEDDLACLRAGWRAGYLLDAARRAAAGEVCEAALAPLSTQKARELLQTVRGVGPKVADCTLLYGLSRWDACPMDVWMKRAMRTLFPKGMPRCAAGAEGIAQQYIFAWARQNLPHGK